MCKYQNHHDLKLWQSKIKTEYVYRKGDGWSKIWATETPYGGRALGEANLGYELRNKMWMFMPQCLGKERRETNSSYLITSLKGIFSVSTFVWFD